MTKRREFLISAASVLAAAFPRVVVATLPCAPPSLTLDGSDSIQSGCATDSPSYISSMSSYQVRALTGNFGPANGFESLHSTTPTGGALGDWTAAYGDNVMVPWSGGAKPLSGSKMYVHGGGHTDSANNGMYLFDYAGTTKPTGWSLAKISATSAVTSGTSAAYADGVPRSVHSYDVMCTLDGMIYRITGAYYEGGNNNNAVWRFNPANATWSRLANLPTESSRGFCIADPASKKILYLERETSYFGYAFYRVGSDTWSSLRTGTLQWPDGGCAAYRPDANPATGTGLVVGEGKAISFSIDWRAEAIAQTSRSLGSVATGAPCCFYDPLQDRFISWGGGTGGGTALHEIDPSTWVVTTRTLSGDPILSGGSSYQGSFGRFVFMDSFRAIGFATSVSGPAYVIKLP